MKRGHEVRTMCVCVCLLSTLRAGVKTVFEMAAMPFPCNGHLLCLCEFPYNYVKNFQ